MRVSRLSATGDWTFGRGRANYATRSEAIRQNVVTRIKSFADDWFLNIDEGIDWIGLLGNRQSEKRILQAVEARVLGTEGVRLIERLRVTGVTERAASLQLTVIDIFDERFDTTVAIP